MFEKDTIVIYGVEGICKITDIANMTFGGFNGSKDYYILVPVSNPTHKVYVPTDSEYLVAKMQKLLSYDEIISLISCEKTDIEWINDNKQRNRYFKEILNSYDRINIFMLAKLLYNIKQGKNENVKKLYASDEEILKKLTKILYSELSCVISLEENDVLPFINGEIECSKK